MLGAHVHAGIRLVQVDHAVEAGLGELNEAVGYEAGAAGVAADGARASDVRAAAALLADALLLGVHRRHPRRPGRPQTQRNPRRKEQTPNTRAG